MMKDLKFAFACQSKTKSVAKSTDAIYTDKYDYSPPNYGPDFAPVYWRCDAHQTVVMVTGLVNTYLLNW